MKDTVPAGDPVAHPTGMNAARRSALTAAVDRVAGGWALLGWPAPCDGWSEAEQELA